MIERGYTALAEDIYFKPASFNHHFWGDIAALMIEYFAGIRINPTTDNIRNVLLIPTFPSQLDFAKASHTLPDGEISAGWKREGDSILFSYEAPDTLTVTVQAPLGYQMLQKDNKTFTFVKL
jgi:alpha-L-rhamnosidase